MAVISSGFRPTSKGFKPKATPLGAKSRTSPNPYTPWLVSRRIIGKSKPDAITTARMSVIRNWLGDESLLIGP